MIPFLSLLLVPAVLAHNISPARRHNSLHPRDGSSRFTYYNAAENEGACGAWHQNSEWVVALPKVQWDNGANCNKEVYITYNGMSAVAKIVDECEGCPWGALDFSESLFGHFVGGEQNNYNVGQFFGSWVYGTGPSNGGGGGGGGDNGDDGDDDTTTTKKAAPTTTKKTTTSTTHTSTSTTRTTSSTHTTSASKSASKSASASIKSVSSTHSASASPTATAAAGPENLHDFAQAVLNLAGMVVQAPEAA